MDQNFQTSFIPKKPIVKERATYSQPVSIFLVASIFILVVVLVGTGGLYFYKGVIAKSITSKENDINLAKNRFEPSKIAELQVLDKRLNAAEEILSKHVAISPLFALLDNITMKTIRYTKFDYILTDNKVDVKMSGVAVGYRSIALQADLLAQNKNLINPIFSDLTLDNSGNVVFDLEFSVDPNFINYKQTLLTQS